jgi:ankyrin repeat protein
MGKKHNKKGKQQVVVPTAQTGDEFDALLAEIRASDLPILATTTTTTTATNTTIAASVTSTTATTVNIASSSSSSARLKDSVPTGSPNLVAAAKEKIKVAEDIIVEACRRGDVRQLRKWGRQGVRFGTSDPITCAVAHNKFDVVRCLVSNLGVSVDQALPISFSITSMAPLHFAAQLGNVDMVLCLVHELGADVNRPDNWGRSPLFIAAHVGNLDVVLCLVKELGAGVNQSTRRSGSTPLVTAAQWGHLEVVRCLAEFGANVNQAMNDVVTPLYSAACAGHFDVVRLLVKEFGADVNQARETGDTPLMAASVKHHSEIVTWLVKAGADPQTTALYGTAADLSKKVGAPAEQTAYLKAKAHCSRPGCSGPGVKKCTDCLQARYCGEVCQQAHWQAHKADCMWRRKELQPGNNSSGKQ